MNSSTDSNVLAAVIILLFFISLVGAVPGNILGLKESPYWLVKPPKGHGWFHERFIECHGLTHRDVADAPEFPAIAPELLACLGRADLVIAHNAGFDIGHLRATLEHFGLECPELNTPELFNSAAVSGYNCQILR